MPFVLENSLKSNSITQKWNKKLINIKQSIHLFALLSFRIRIEEETRRLEELKQKQEEEEQIRYELERLRLLEVRTVWGTLMF